jgi:hypothetical protein
LILLLDQDDLSLRPDDDEVDFAVDGIAVVEAGPVNAVEDGAVVR